MGPIGIHPIWQGSQSNERNLQKPKQTTLKIIFIVERLKHSLPCRKSFGSKRNLPQRRKERMTKPWKGRHGRLVKVLPISSYVDLLNFENLLKTVYVFELVLLSAPFSSVIYLFTYFRQILSRVTETARGASMRARNRTSPNEGEGWRTMSPRDYVTYSSRTVCRFFIIPHNIYVQGLWDRAYCLSSLSEKTRKFNSLQMSLQRQHFNFSSVI